MASELLKAIVFLSRVFIASLAFFTIVFDYLMPEKTTTTTNKTTTTTTT
ncbi:MAG: hypothetical protein JW778_02675 [Candidatus Altiarchaeota archaeon]|nr:hypothetical protein [Candidatus Altiarchaeota archaeon]